MQGACGWRRWCCRTPGNEPHDFPFSNEEIRHPREAVRVIGSPSLSYSLACSFDSFDAFNFFNLDIFGF
jgi:hypothetical protein